MRVLNKRFDPQMDVLSLNLLMQLATVNTMNVMAMHWNHRFGNRGLCQSCLMAPLWFRIQATIGFVS
jgi:hypothetical protein